MKIVGALVLSAVALSIASGNLASADSAANPATGAQMLAQAHALLDNAARELDNNAAAIETNTGLAGILHARLVAHTALLANGDNPEELLRLAQLDAGLVDQLSNQTYPALAGARGASALVLPSIGARKRPYPLALYVPASYSAQRASPLIVYLHGKDESEANVVASSLIRTLADDAGAVIVAPSMHGNDMLSDDSISELYQVVDAVENALNIDRHRAYLAGNSLGGFASFKALSHQPERWSALLVVEGAVAESDSSAVAAHVRGKPVYLVAGGDDLSIKASYMRQLAVWLRGNGALVSYYEQPNGAHTLASVAPMVGKAWHDMLAGSHIAPDEQNLAAPTPTPRVRP